MWLDLNHSRKLRTLSGLSLAKKLQSINLEGCTELKTVHEVLQTMESLVFLNLRGCTSLVSLPQMNLISLKTLILSGCLNLEEYNLILESLEELSLDGTAIKKLPSNIGDLQRLVLLTLKDCRMLLSLPESIKNLKALQKLVLSGCSSLATFPEVKENLKHLKTLLLDGTAIKEMPHLLRDFNVNQGQPSSSSHCNFCTWPHETYRLSLIQRLCLSRNNFRSLPDNIRYLYNLKWLNLKYCKQLISLPMLPPNLHSLDAHGCISLKNIESPLALILEETEYSHSTFIFTNCAKLDQVAKNGIVTYVRKKIQSMSDALPQPHKGSKFDVLIGVCYPGWQLPVWFNYQIVGSELTQTLPRHWNEDGLTGIALCAVVTFEDYQAQNNRLLVRCTCEFYEEDQSLIQFTCILGVWTEHGNDRPRDIIKSSGHVFIGYTSLLDIKKWDKRAGCVAREASFKFQVTDGTRHIENCEVRKCGFTLIYAPTKPVHRLCTDHGEITSCPTTDIGGNIMSEESHEMTPNMGNEIEEVQSLRDTRNASEIPCGTNSVAALSRSIVEDHLQVRVDATPMNDDTSGRSMSLDSLAEDEVTDEDSPKNDVANGSTETDSCLSTEDTKISDKDHSSPNGRKNLYEMMRKPLRLLRVVITIYAIAAFVLRKENNKR